MNFLTSLVWPLPALLGWALGWLVFFLASRGMVWWLALLLACALSVGCSLWGSNWWRRSMIALGFPLSWLVLAAGDIPSWAWLLPLGLLLLVYPLNAWRDAPVFPTPAGALDGLAQHVPLPAGAVLLDAGCGAGDGMQALRRAWPQAQIHGVEWSWPLRCLSALRCPWARVRQGDIWAIDWSAYDMVYLFQRPESMSRAAVKAMGELRDGSWLVSLNFPVPDMTAQHTAQAPDGRMVYAYQAPLAEVDHDSVHADAIASWLPARPQGTVVRGQSLYPRRGRPGGRKP